MKVAKSTLEKLTIPLGTTKFTRFLWFKIPDLWWRFSLLTEQN